MINYPVIVNTVKNHKKHKPILLNYIEELKQNSNTRYENIDTDWSLPKEIKRNYLDYFYNDVIEPTIIEIGNQLGFNSKFNWYVGNSWFQQYGEKETHNWHNHPNGQFTNCYFLELPDNKYKTEILGLDGQIIDYEANEGDVLTIPAWMRHRSPCNGKQTKTVIAFNTDYLYDYKTN